jgi:amino acid adenylation domain-containing protein
MSSHDRLIAQLPPDQRRLILRKLAERRTEQTQTIQKVARDRTDFPVSYAQERLWFLDQLSPGNSFYNLAFARQISHLDHRALECALTALVERHEGLRTTLPVVDHQPVQRIAAPAPMACPLVDLAAHRPRHVEAEVHRIAAELTQAPFDLAVGPLLRAALIRTGFSASVFVFVIHHIISDAWSLEIIFRELGVLYADALAQRPPSLPPIAMQYVDYTVWQRRWLEGDIIHGQLDYWRRQLADLPTLNFPTDHRRPPVQAYRGKQLEFDIAGDVVAGLRRLARDEDATLFMVLLAACFVLLHRYSHQDDIVVGTPVANRNRLEFENTVGFFVNNLVMRADLSGNPTFRDLLRQVRETALDAYSNQDLPFSRLVTAMKTERDLSRNPLYQVSFQLMTATRADQSARAEVARDLFLERSTAIFDLAFNLVDTGTDVLGRVEFSTDLFDEETIKRMRTHFGALLDSILTAPDRPVRRLAILDDEERLRLVVEWNATDGDREPETCLHTLFEEQARRTPDAVAVTCGTRTMTYAELNQAADALSECFRPLAAGPRPTIGVLMSTEFELVVSVLAILKAGLAYVPLDPAVPMGRLVAMVHDAEPACIVTSAELAAFAEKLHPDVVVTHTSRGVTSCPGRLATVDATPGGRTAHGAKPEHLAYVMFTSGSTGRPKGVMISHSNVVNYLRWCRRTYPVDAGVGAPLASPFSSDMSITSLFLPLITGKSVVLLDDDDLVEALDVALRDGPTFSFVKLTPSHLVALRNLSIGRNTRANTAAFIVGGEALQGETIGPWRDEAPDIMIFNEYGPTEATVGCSVYAVRAADVQPGPVPIGRPIANTRLYVLDPDGSCVPIGVTGELYIGGAGVAIGYLGDADGGPFVPDPFGTPGDRLYRTGDLARYRSDGVLEYLGRIDRQVQIRGFRVEPGDVEATISELPDVTAVVVAAQEFGYHDSRLIAFVVPANGADVDTLPRRVVAHARNALPAHFVPSRVVVVDTIPLTSSGKANLRQLHALSHGRGDIGSDDEPIAPRTPLEELMALIFAQVLQVPSVSVNRDFFAQLGGDSLLATQVVARLRDYLQVDLPLRTLFEAPTAAEMVAHLTASGRSDEMDRAAREVLEILAMSDAEIAAQLAADDGRAVAGERIATEE